MIFVEKILQKILFSAFLALLVVLVPGQSASAQQNQGVVIYQIQTGSEGSASSEYVSIYNNSDEDIDITNWCLVYSSASDKTQTQLNCQVSPDPKIRIMLGKRKFATFATADFETANNHKANGTFPAGLAATSGHVKLIDSNKNTVDLVGWGTSANPEHAATKAHSSGNVLQRKFLDNKYLQDTNSNLDDFISIALNIPNEIDLFEQALNIECPSHRPNCAEDGPIISEIFPNPEGADTGKEFIELYNPHSYDINLGDYILQLGPSFSKQRQFNDVIIPPNQYVAFSDIDVGFSLPNTEGSLRLVNQYGIIIDLVKYGQVPEGMSLAYYEGEWHNTYDVTMGSENRILTELPCESGKVRNPETGRCVNSNNTDNLKTSCKPNQERNPDTGRCRNIVNKIAAACKPNQIRNLDTGRCKNIPVASLPKPCAPGQQRNKETNRCRKIADKINKAKVKDIESPLIKNSPKWWMAGVGVFGATGYAIFEWRREIFKAFSIRR